MKILILTLFVFLNASPLMAQGSEDLTGKRTPIIETDETGAIIDRDDYGNEVYTGSDGLFSVDPEHSHEGHNHFYEQPETILDIAKNDTNFSTFARLVNLAGLSETLEAEGPFTVFMPADYAFNNLAASTAEMLERPENRNKLQSVLKNHIVEGVYMTMDVEDGVTTLQALSGRELKLIKNAFGMTVNGVKVVGANTTSGNGVVHILDSVLISSSNDQE